MITFQSQPRSQPPGDPTWLSPMMAFNLCFNLNREASPLATECEAGSGAVPHKFQSQPRSQPPGDTVPAYRHTLIRCVSISTEKPAPWRLPLVIRQKPRADGFNLNREASPLA